jgi:Rrf2 family protein
MMRINRRTDYAIRVMLALAKQPSKARLPTHRIQQMMLVPRAFLLRIIADLSRAGLVLTYAGPKGGVQLARDPAAINLNHIWEAIEGPLLISNCLEVPQGCQLNDGCPVNDHWAKIQRMILQELESTDLRGLAEEAYELAGSRPQPQIQ